MESRLVGDLLGPPDDLNARRALLSNTASLIQGTRLHGVEQQG